MRHFLRIVSLSVAFFCWAAPHCLAQAGYIRPPLGGPFNPPPTSPYLNLNRGGNPAINYFNLVRPEFEFRNAYQSLQRQVNLNRDLVREALTEEGVPATGHSTSFLNYSHYFPGPGARAVTRSFGAATTTRPQLQSTPAPRSAPGGRR
ncbi:MAG TPA: hypothetical protein VKD72_12585 [Gemmataceae bacterium]|nr:hypothetical protein [Gemmataceae bacterium]